MQLINQFLLLCLGYDPALVNPYLPKVLENLGALVYEEAESEGQTYFNITAVVSSHGEQLMLKQVNTIWLLYNFLFLCCCSVKVNFMFSLQMPNRLHCLP